MGKVWAMVAAMFVGICIMVFLLVGGPESHHERYTYLILRGAAQQQATPQAPPGNWLLIRRIPRP